MHEITKKKKLADGRTYRHAQCVKLGRNTKPTTFTVDDAKSEFDRLDQEATSKKGEMSGCFLLTNIGWLRYTANQIRNSSNVIHEYLSDNVKDVKKFDKVWQMVVSFYTKK